MRNKLRLLQSHASATASEAWAWTILFAESVATKFSETTAWESLNSFKNEVSKSMDQDFTSVPRGSIDVETGLFITPNNHRILDGGHDIFSSIDLAREIGTKEEWTNVETFENWSKAYLRDISSDAGMPVFGKITDNVYAFLRNTLDVDEAIARDLVTVNGPEILQSVLAGTVSAIGFYFAWKNEDKDTFSKIAASLIVGSAVAMNPVSLGIAVTALAIGYQRLVCPNGLAKGGIITAASLSLSAMIPGPLLLGAIPAMVLAIYLNKRIGKDFDIKMFASELIRKSSKLDFSDVAQRFETEATGTTAQLRRTS